MITKEQKRKRKPTWQLLRSKSEQHDFKKTPSTNHIKILLLEITNLDTLSNTNA